MRGFTGYGYQRTNLGDSNSENHWLQNNRQRTIEEDRRDHTNFRRIKNAGLADEEDGRREPITNSGFAELVRQCPFHIAFRVWSDQMKTLMSVTGTRPLLEYALKKHIENRQICRDRIALMYRESSELLRPSEFIAYLIVSLISSGFQEDAQIIGKLFSIDGTYLIAPLISLSEKASEENSLKLIEAFASYLEATYFKEQATKRPKKKQAKPRHTVIESFPTSQSSNNSEDGFVSAMLQGSSLVEQEVEPIQTLASQTEFEFLLSIWKHSHTMKPKQYTRKEPKVKVHKVDALKLEILVQKLADMWVRKSRDIYDVASLSRFCEFITRNELKIRQSTVELCENVFMENGCSSPFDCVP